MLAVAALGCGGEAPVTPPPPPVVAAVVVTPEALTIPEGESRTLAARVEDADGTALSGHQVVWTSTHPVVASVSAQGRVTALLPGSALIIASVGPLADTSAITIPAAPIATVHLTPATEVIEVGVTLDLDVLVRDIFGREVLAPMAWESTDATVATVSPSGAVTALSPGTAEIRAMLGGVTGRAWITVVRPTVARVQVSPDSLTLVVGESFPLTLSVTSAREEVLVDRATTWVSAIPTVVSVAANGELSAEAVGGSWVVAEVEGVRDSTWVTVETPPPAGFHLTVTNHLLLPAQFTLNGMLIATLAPGQRLRLFRPPEVGLRAAWSLVRPTVTQGPLGEAVLDTFPPITGADRDTIDLPIRARLTDGRRLVIPVLTNVSGSTVLLSMADRQQAGHCWCVVPSGGEAYPRMHGYWFLTSTQQMLLHRRGDAPRTGPFLSIPIPSDAVDPLSGIWPYRIVTGP